MTTARGIVVIGIGAYRHDDSVGRAVLACLEDRAARRPLPTGTTLTVCDGDPARLIDSWEGAQLAVVVEAAHEPPGHPERPGLVHRLELDGDRLWRAGPAASVNGHGVAGAVELARALGRLPERLVVYSVEGADDTLGEGLSGPVAAVVGAVARRVENDVVDQRVAAALGGR